MKKLLIVLFLFLGTTLFQTFQKTEWWGQIFQYDAAGYYLYLPATFIYHDLDKLSYYTLIDSVHKPSPGSTWHGIHYQPKTGKRLNKYPIGLAIGELPFFLGAHAYALTAKTHQADGYTVPYRFAVCMGTLVWALIGLFFLGRFLALLFGANVAAATAGIIGFGTNVYCYSVTQFGMAHIFLFMLFSMLLYYTIKWHETGRNRCIYYLAVISSLIVITRPTDILVLLFPLLWNTWSSDLREKKITFAKAARIHLLLGSIIFFSILFLQLAYWKWITGDWVHFSYENEYFDFIDPEILAGLFSYRKGWFLYTPLALIGMIGFLPLSLRHRGLAILSMVYFGLAIYIVFSWHQWWYGWSFGCRALIESLAVLSIPLAALVQYLSRQKLWIVALPVLGTAFFIWLNIYQTNQFLTYALPGDHITKAYYWRVWNRMHVEEEDRKLLW